MEVKNGISNKRELKKFDSQELFIKGANKWQVEFYGQRTKFST